MRAKRYCYLLFAVILACMMMTAPVLAVDTNTCQHSWEFSYTVQSPTCGSPGTDAYRCSLCGASKNVSVPATGEHDWEDWEVDKSPTIFRKGSATRECWYCGATQTKELKKISPFAKFGKKTYKIVRNKSLNLKKKLKFGKGDKVVKWKSSNKSIATITSKGVIKAKRSGTVKITAKLKSGKKATCKIKVTNPKGSSTSNKSSGGGTVYWVPSGSVYHSTSSCPTLSRSRTIYSGSLSECPKSRPCKVCH